MGEAALIQGGSNVQLLVTNGSQTQLDLKAFILLHIMQLRCSAGSQNCRHCVMGQTLNRRGLFISNIVHKGGTNQGRALIRGNTVAEVERLYSL